MLINHFSHPVTATVAIAVLIGSVVYFCYTKHQRYQARQAFKSQYNCLPPHGVYPIKEPLFGVDFAIAVVRAARQKRLLPWFDTQFRRYGPTYTVSNSRGMAVHTAEAENFKAVLQSKFEDWSAGPARQAFKSLLGDSLFMTDGAQWAHSRAILRPSFAKESVADLGLFENHFQALLRLLPEDGSTIELKALFGRFSFDVGTEFLFGQSVGSLTATGERSEQAGFAQDIDVSIQDAVDRTRYLALYPLLGNKDAPRAIKGFHEGADKFVQAALVRAAKEDQKESASRNGERYSFLSELARETKDPERMRYEAVGMLFAGRDTSTTVLSNLWFLLARHPEVWNKLLAEVDELNGEKPTHEWIWKAEYLKYCEHEAQRLYSAIPILPPRTANKDTVLPVGGGPDGRSPLFAPKGTNMVLHLYAAGRRKDVWGEDAEQFEPERWRRYPHPGWNYVPFSRGPRSCLGQQFALNEIYYVTVRLMQHFRRIEPRDDKPFEEEVQATLNSANGVLVGLFPE